ncbi:HAD-IA family hydrolase [Cyanobium sp. WAJ14-Wanaka]|uniref:HAD-IA family hydrolase n=1 Tax=Cyanobium sp. WAJ14-Wanaka TaxID=2823725 RepID=UPI0020CEFF38|nr:HAD-IA family hydrolase [Cyanobium sp. WAJ14-Wanaka]MCP9774418.1 HAD-IA family hydrolase [Cyanobium sp. WAJ14-Wanaka]
MALGALLWDVDGTLAETERDGHRLAFNRAFADAGLPLHWDPGAYGRHLATTGGAERIAAALAELEGQPPAADRVRALQASKQTHYADLVAGGCLELRPGVRALMEEAHGAGLRQVLVTTSGRVAVRALVAQLLPTQLLHQDQQWLDFWICGEDVSRKKPDPEAYAQALARLDLEPGQALALEDSRAGLMAAQAAGVPCLVSLSHYGRLEPLDSFAMAVAVVDQLGSGARVLRGPACQEGRITLSYLQSLR